MSEALDKVLALADCEQKTVQYLKSIGVEDERAALMGAKSLSPSFTWDGVRLTYKESGTVAVDDPGVAAQIKKEYPFLFPKDDPAKRADVKLDPAVVASALAGNLTAKGRIVRELGTLAAADAALAAAKTKAPDKSAAGESSNKDRKNPWLPGQFNVTEQGRIIKTLGLPAAQRLAEAAGVHIGAVRPAKVA